MWYRSAQEAGADSHHPVVAIGNFDGVHRGHQAVLRQAALIARDGGRDVRALSFEPHPVRFFRPEVPAFELTTLGQKAELIEATGARLVAQPFDGAFAALTPEEFVETVLRDHLGASCVIVGSDFVFGKGRAGNTTVLVDLCAQRGIDVELAPLVVDDELPISSTRIRAAIADGALGKAADLLGRSYAVVGKVVRGEGNGKTFGFPTANLAVRNPVLPPDGIYATRLTVESHPPVVAATYVGTRPTLGLSERVVEAFALDVEEFDVYGQEASLQFVERVRADRQFENVDAMILQMERDVSDVRLVMGLR